MQYIKLLFKRDFIESISSYKQKKDILGIISSFFLLSAIYGVFIYVFSHFAQIYIATDFGNVLLRNQRVEELFTICFGAIFIINVVVGIKKLIFVLNSTKDSDILIYQPIGAGSIFVYKLLKVYFSQIFSTILTIVPIAICIDSLSSLVGGIDYYLFVVAIIILLPFISCALATLFAVPFMAVMKKIASKFIVMLCIYVVIVAIGFLLYGSFLSVLSELVRSGNIKYVFDFKTIKAIGEVTKWLYPSKFFTNIILYKSTILNIIAIILISVAAVAISYFIIKKVYIKTIQNQLEGNYKPYRNSSKLKEHSPTVSLLYKEFVVVLRTPTYAFQYFAIAITLPFMVYICSFILQSMLETLTVIDCNYALAIFVVSMLSILTNTFCTTNISRDGKMFAIMKTLPVTIYKIISVKLIFCSIVSFVSVLISCFVLLVTGFLNLTYFFITFIVGFAFSLVQIAYSTRKDMKHPCLPSNAQDEIVEGNSSMSTIIITGLITTIVTGGGALLLSVVVGIKYNEFIASCVSIGFVFVVTIISLIFSFIYLFKGVDEEYYLN